jgi:4-diphosphocytidyl-2-C-methyl-D-erythritol kinase
MIDRHGSTAAGLDPVPAKSIRRMAPAKVNLFLEVLGKRPDGYHEIATLILAIDLADVLDFAVADDGSLSLTCDDPALTIGPDNLVLKAALRLRAEVGCTAGAAIRLSKRIPWAAGLGGGSSDAAATLLGLNELWRLGVSRKELARIGAAIGSDVPFFLNGTAAWCTGRGETIDPVPIGRPLDLVLVKPPEGLATAEVYRRLQLPPTAACGFAAKSALAAGDIEALGQALFNRLEEPAFAMSPDIADWRRRLLTLGTAGVLMSGSGSCLFALCRNASEAWRVHDDLSRGLTSEAPSETRIFLVRSWP